MIDYYFQLIKTPTDHLQQELIFPDCTPGILYVQKGSFIRKNQQSLTPITEGNIYLFGQKTRSVEYLFENSDLLAFGLKLSPSSLYAFFNISAEELTDQVVELETVRKDTDQFTEWLQASKGRMPLSTTNAVPDLLVFILDYIHRNRGNISIQELLKQYPVGYKKLQRLFKLYIGITPKRYARIIRFNHSIRLGIGNPYKLTDIAYQSGYFDQNHYIKETKHFTGAIPSQLLARGRASFSDNHLAYLDSRAF